MAKYKVTITATVDTENEEDMDALQLDSDGSDYTSSQIKSAVEENVDLSDVFQDTTVFVDAQ